MKNPNPAAKMSTAQPRKRKAMSPEHSMLWRQHRAALKELDSRPGHWKPPRKLGKMWTYWGSRTKTGKGLGVDPADY